MTSQESPVLSRWISEEARTPEGYDGAGGKGDREEGDGGRRGNNHSDIYSKPHLFNGADNSTCLTGLLRGLKALHVRHFRSALGSENRIV